jgi:hypothetical protein
MKPVLLKNVGKGEKLTLTNNVKHNEDGEVPSKYVYVRDDYARETKKYEYYNYFNVGEWNMRKGTCIVYIGFEF